ncbi:MAG: preprotein translocase subunit SecE [Actinomycetota bacterium]|nr:preprotein translocase subunit SecE [Acidimicrobiaceae bacterium]MEC7116110.1 preprotein translocase subunit SecE [Actinomycetota bacterium]MEC7608241.1 preprotein translocase subunit SecE [Actinomycetota bacterium]MEC8118529.1 preprotein translocase subunit SecE [Actinomycetota bacterium]|tara:strand:- start:1522 stop:1821 length:300 start_codon:yes stop_codon:yes gene_type:complete
MSLNREQKRALKKRGELGEDGTPVATRRQPAGKPQQEQRVGFRRYLSEVRSELRKVAWPTRSEVINYSIVVLVTLVVITSMIALMDWGFGEGLLKLFER